MTVNIVVEIFLDLVFRYILTLTAKEEKKRPQPLQIKGLRPSYGFRNM